MEKLELENGDVGPSLPSLQVAVSWPVFWGKCSFESRTISETARRMALALWTSTPEPQRRPCLLVSSSDELFRKKRHEMVGRPIIIIRGSSGDPSPHEDDLVGHVTLTRSVGYVRRNVHPGSRHL